MKVSVVIPAYNAGHFLKDTVTALQAQHYIGWEAVIIDDGSGDDTYRVAQTLSDTDGRIRVTRQTNAGVAAARNQGWAETNDRAEYVMFLDQDDLLEPDALGTLMEALDADASAVAAHGLARYIDDQGQIWRPGKAEALTSRRKKVKGCRLVAVSPGQPTGFSTLVYRNCIWTPGQVLIRRSALKAAGLFNQSTAPCDDWDMWVRLSYRGDIAAVGKVVLNFRRHGGNNSNDRKRMRGAELAMRRNLLAMTAGDTTARRVALRGYRHCEFDSGTLTLRLAAMALAQRRAVHSLKYLRHAAIFYARAIPGVPI